MTPNGDNSRSRTGVTSWLVRTRVRRRAAGLVPLALIVIAGGTGSLVAIGAAQRTATAFDRYLERADVGSLRINPSMPTAEIDAVIRSLPGVRSITTHELLNVVTDDNSVPAPDAPLGGNGAQIIGSTDGRFLTMDRPAMHSGRAPTGHDEAIVDLGMANDFHLHIGDVVPLSFVSSVDQVAYDDAQFSAPPGAETPPMPKPTPVGTERVTIVGIAALTDEVLPDGVYPRERMIVSPDVARRYSCSPEPIPAEGTYEQIVAAVFPEGCAINYRYYSLTIDGGDAGVRAAQDAFVRRGAELTAQLPQAMRDRGVGYELIPTTTAKDRARVERATGPTVAALAVLGLAAGLVTVVVAGLAAARELRRSVDEQLQWWRLGLTTGQRARATAVPLAATVVIGLAVSLLLGWWWSPLGPVGNVRTVEPNPDRTVSVWDWWMLLALGVVLVVAVGWLALASSRRVARPRVARRGVSVIGGLVGRSARPEVGEGIRAASDRGRSAGLVVASGAVAVAVLLTAVVFGASLSSLVSTPRSYGWPWDVALVGGFGYGGLDAAQVDTSLAGRHDVTSWTVAAFTNSVSLDGEPVTAIVGLGDGTGLDFALSAGRLPRTADEVALGTTTAADHGVGVGDQIEVAGDNIETHRVTVTGLTVLPALGPFESERMSPGEGMVLHRSMFQQDALTYLAAFVGIKVADGADRSATLTALRGDYPSWHADEFTVDFASPIRPAEIIDVESVRSVPLLVGGLLGAAVVVGLALVVGASVRARRHEFAILRALGFTGRQLRRSVRVQAMATMLGALVVGVPVGIVTGRFAWRAFASRLAVVQPPTVPVGWVVGIVVAAVIAALIAAVLPALAAGRSRPAIGLRPE